jgi:hypothetical protein
MHLALRQTGRQLHFLALALAFVAIATFPGDSRGEARAGGVPGRQTFPAVAFDGTNYLVVWMDERPGGAGSDIYGARVSRDGTVVDPGGIAISTAAGDQQKPALAFDGTNYLVVWMDDRSGTGTGFDIFAARVTPAGAVLDPDGFAISFPRSGCSACIVRPALGFDGTNYLVVWRRDLSGSSAIYGARVSPAGVVLDPGGIAISTAPGFADGPVLAFGGSNYLVAWANTGSGDVYGARVSPAGTVLDPAGIPISTAANFQFSPALAFDGMNYLVAWGDYRTRCCDVYGARVSTAGSVLDPGGIPIATGTNSEGVFPTLAFGGGNYFVAWNDNRSEPFGVGRDIYGARVSPAGAVLDPGGIAVSTAPSYQEFPALAFDGANYLIGWADWRLNPDTDVYAARVSPAGAVFDPAGILISTVVPPPPLPPPPSTPPPTPPPAPVQPPPARSAPRARPCRVPRVVGLRLAAARGRIRRSHCSVGRIRRARSRRVGFVISQSPRPGRVLRRGARVNLLVGRR